MPLPGGVRFGICLGCFLSVCHAYVNPEQKLGGAGRILTEMRKFSPTL